MDSQKRLFLDVENALQSEPSTERLAKQNATDQRQESRVDYRTTGFAYHLGESGLKPLNGPIRIWTVDVSTQGCLVRSREEIASKRVLIKLLLPQLKESLLEAHIVRELQDSAKLMNGKEQESHLYGIKFTRILNQNEIAFELPDELQYEKLEDSPQTDSRVVSEECIPSEQGLLSDPGVITVILLTLGAILSLGLVFLF